jgi:hypothetical protein
MCLSVVSKIYTSLKLANRNFGIGYKNFYSADLEGVRTHLDKRKESLKYGVWIKDKATGNIEALYPKDFHIFTSEQDAKSYSPSHSVKRVRYRNVVAYGKQNDTDVGATIIAREIYIERD